MPLAKLSSSFQSTKETHDAPDSPAEADRRWLFCINLVTIATAEVQPLLQEGTDQTETDNETESAFHHAAWQGHTDTLKLLLGADTDPYSRDMAGQMPLHHAVSNGFRGIVQLLLERWLIQRLKIIEGRRPHSLADQDYHRLTAGCLPEKERRPYGSSCLLNLVQGTFKRQLQNQHAVDENGTGWKNDKHLMHFQRSIVPFQRFALAYSAWKKLPG